MAKSPKDKDSEKKSPMDDLIHLMDQEKLQELEVWDGESRIRLSRQSQQPMVPIASMGRTASQPKKKNASKKEEAQEAGLAIKSPLAGVFYRASSPQAPPFIKEGDVVAPDKTVCIIEAMKVLNQINAGVSGRVVRACVENGKPVSAGQALFIVEAET